MDLPVIDPPIFPRWVWIEEITYSHIPIATLITAFMVLAPVYEYIGFKKNDPRYDRLARSLINFSLILFSPGAALGTGIPMWIMGTYPEFWSRWSNLFFWPLIAQFGFFIGEVVFLFFFYYLAWDRLQTNKRLHIFFGSVAAAFGLLVQIVWDALGSYMLTPGDVALPAVDNPVAWSARAFFNPSFPFLFFHRFFGNISYAMLLAGGILAIRSLALRDASEKEYFDFASRLTFTVGFLAFFAMPLIGWGYAGVIKEHAPMAFHAIMGGHVSPHFMMKMSCIIFLVTVGAVHLFQQFRQKTILIGLTAGLAGIYLVFHWHPPIRLIPGGPMIWRIFYTLLLAGFLLFLWLVARKTSFPERLRQWSMFAVGIAAFIAFLIGGFVRERSKNPYTVYGEIVKPEVIDREADRFLFYHKCFGCHRAADFKDLKQKDWRHVIRRERQRPEVSLTDAEAARIARYLEEKYR